MPDWIIPVIIAVIGSSGLWGVVTYYANRRNINMEADTKQQSSIVDDTKDIRDMYRDALKDEREKHERQTLEKDKRILELEKERDTLRARLEESRGKIGELLVKVDDVQRTVNKVDGTVNKVENNVNQITGDFGKFPLVNDRQSEPYGRRASDKPNGEQRNA